MWSIHRFKRALAVITSTTLSVVVLGLVGFGEANAQGWPALQTDAAGAKVLASFKRGPYGSMAKGRMARETLVPGIYALVDPTGKYGPIFTDAKITRMKNGTSAWIDVPSGSQLSSDQVKALRSDMARRLDVGRAIPFTYGSGSEKAILVSAYDCPYCRRLEEKLDSGSFNATVYLFPMALQHNRPGPMAVARDIWCSSQPTSAWKAAILQGQNPAPAPTTCSKDARDTSMLMALFDIKGVPARIGADGRISQM